MNRTEEIARLRTTWVLRLEITEPSKAQPRTARHCSAGHSKAWQ